MSSPSSVDDVSQANQGPPEVRPRVRTRRRFWWLLAVTLVVAALLYAPLWQAVVRRMLIREAARHGYVLTIGRMEGGLFETVHLYGARCRQPGLGTDLRVAHAELTPAWHIPWLQPPPPLTMRRLVLAGVSGCWDLAAPPAGETTRGFVRSATRTGWWLVPAKIFVQGDDLCLRRNRYQLRARGLRLSLERDAPGLLLARELEIAGPGFANTLLNRHAQTLWQKNRLVLSGLEFGPGVKLLNATLDGTHLSRQRLDWECGLAVLGGEVRGQGAINFLHPRLALEIAATLRRLPVAPLARVLGVTRPAGGSVEQGSFSFRGDPEDWTNAQMWLSAQAVNFRWGPRDWQNLELRATVLHRRIQVRRLELQQSRNRVSLTGECPLFSPGQIADRWWEAGFACNVDARLEDLRDLTQLFGARLPDLEGRMSVNGTLEALPGRPGIAGYLNVEGSRLRVRGAPLDYLRSTLLFRGGDLNVADLQATHGADYFTGHGSVSLAGAYRYYGETHLAMSDAAEYAPALAGFVDLGARDDYPIRLDGIFYGPDANGEATFLTFADLIQLPVPPTLFDHAN